MGALIKSKKGLISGFLGFMIVVQLTACTHYQTVLKTADSTLEIPKNQQTISLDEETENDVVNITATPAQTDQINIQEPFSNLGSSVIDYESELISASLKYVANSTEEANEIARSIGYINGLYECASNMCSPLSIAILRDAGFLLSVINPHNSWLPCLQEREDCNSLTVLQREYFPPQAYEYIYFDENIRNFDFTENPLMPGDFLYLFSADTGYDHMLVVTRVDNEGAAYSVTNADRGDGFKIQEELLYHPQKPQEGFFYEFTDRSRGMLAMTGNGGMVIIRRIGGLNTLPQLTKSLEHTLIPGVKWHSIIKEIGNSTILFESLPNDPMHPASMIKIPMTMVMLHYLDEQQISLDFFGEKGFGGRTFEQLLYAVVVNSEERASEILLNYIRENGGERKVLDSWGLYDTRFNPRRTTMYDLVNALEGLYTGQFISSEMQTYLLLLMSTQTENDSNYLGKITSVVDNSIFYNKRGTLVNPTIVSDMGILTFEDRAFILVISGTPISTGSATYEDIQASIEAYALSAGTALLEMSTK